jgi:copper transport protein
VIGSRLLGWMPAGALLCLMLAGAGPAHAQDPDALPDDTTSEPLVNAPASIRWLGYLALFPVVGAVAFRGLARRRVPPPGGDDVARNLEAGARRIGTAAAVVLVAAAALRLYIQVRSILEPEEAFTAAVARPIVTGTAWGSGWTLQAAAAIVALLGLLAARWLPATGWGLAGLGALGAVIASPLTGHAIENPWGPRVGAALQAAHLLGGAVWLGTLFVLVATAYGATRHTRSSRREQVIATLVDGYSPMALIGGLATMGAGVLLAFAYIDSFGQLWSTTYGRALLLKVAILVGVAAVGAYNWRRVRPALGSAPGAGRLRRSATIELILGTLLLATTAVLVALPAPGL